MHPGKKSTLPDYPEWMDYTHLILDPETMKCYKVQEEAEPGPGLLRFQSLLVKSVNKSSSSFYD